MSSQHSESSQTAQDYIASQLSLEADAREALPYQFDTCTKPLGPLRQSVYACLTCTPPPASPHQQFTPAGVCYSCSISCHGEHNLVELFSKRDFVCDCGTTRLSNGGTPCSLRLNAQTNAKGGVTGEEARQGNKYNQNFQGKFCGCGEEYDPVKEKGTMFQCLGLGTVEDGGCGEDWWHPECLMGLPRMHQPQTEPIKKEQSNGHLETVEEEGEFEAPASNPTEQSATNEPEAVRADVPDGVAADTPPGFPSEDDFEHLICYKCTAAFPWIKQYDGTSGFLPAVSADGSSSQKLNGHTETTSSDAPDQLPESRKRSAEDAPEEVQESKKTRTEDKISGAEDPAQTNGHAVDPAAPRHSTLPPAPTGPVSLFLDDSFRDHLCRCASCFPRLARHPALLEEEDTYSPPISESSGPHDETGSVGGRSMNSGSLLDRGEAALSTMDRVRAIEGVMAYNHVRDKVKAFLQPFAESGRPVGAEDVKAYFAGLRGDEVAAAGDVEGGGVERDHRKEGEGY